MSLRDRINRAPVGLVIVAEVRTGLRRRRKMPQIAALSKSLDKDGLIHPIVIDDTGNLVSGERRLTAAKRLGWKKIKAVRVKITLAELRELELTENKERADLDAFEASKARMVAMDREAKEILENASGAESSKSAKTLRRDATIEARKRLGIPARTEIQDRQIVKDVAEFPMIAGWARRPIKQGAEALRCLPPDERQGAAFLAGTFTKREASHACDALENLVDNIDPDVRKEIYKRARSKDPEIVLLAQTTASSLYPVPDPWFGHMKVALDELKEIVQKRKKRDYAQGRIRAAHQELQAAVKFLHSEYNDVRKQVIDELKGNVR